MMKSRFATWMTLATVVMVVGMATAADPIPGFLTEYKPAQAEAQKQDKPLMLHFTTTWCTWCRRIENDIYKKPAGQEGLKAFVPATLDCTVPRGQKPRGTTKLNLELMKKYGGQGYPFVVITAPDGTKLAELRGYVPMAQFQKFLNKGLESQKLYRDFQAVAKEAGPDSPEYQAKALDFYLEVADWKQAAEMARKLQAGKADPKLVDPAKISYALFVGEASKDKADPAVVQSLAGKVVAADPKNEKGFLEPVMMYQAERTLQASGRGRTDTEKAKIAEAIKTFQQLTTQAETLENGQQIYAMMGLAQHQLGQDDQALASMRKALAVDPKSGVAKRIRQMITRLEAQVKAKETNEAK